MIYLDNAATTFPKPNCVIEEITKCLKKYCGNPGRSAHSLSLKSAEKIFETRELIADFFDASSENVIFTYNTTYAINIAIKSLLKYSTHVLISDIEHNSVLRPIAKCAEQKLCTYDIFDTSGDEDSIIKSIENKLKTNTTMLVCTHSSNIGERVLPIEKIGKLCKSHNITFIVDAAQSAGIHHISVKNMHIDALCVPGHKGLYGPQGVGFVVFGNDIVGRSIIEGGTGINSLELLMPNFYPEIHEAGTLSTPSIVGLNEAIKWLTKLGVDNVRTHEEELYTMLFNLLSQNDAITLYKMNQYAGNTMSFNICGLSSSYVASELNKRDICVRSGFHCSPLGHKVINSGKSGTVRVGIGVFNTKNDIYNLCDAIFEIINDNNKKIRH